MDKNVVESLTEAGRVAAKTHKLIGQKIAPGVNLLELEAIAKDEIKKAGMRSAFLGFKGYPAVTCLSVNHEVVHGIPRSYVLIEGDVVSVDLGVEKNGWKVDTARTWTVGKTDPYLVKLLKVTHESLNLSMAAVRSGNHVGDIGYAIQNYVETNGYHIVRDLTGHGVGKTLQEPPSIPNFGRPNQGPILKKGMILAIEPIVTDRAADILLAEDGWTIISDNGAIAAHFEDTVIVTDAEPIILTRDV